MLILGLETETVSPYVDVRVSDERVSEIVTIGGDQIRYFSDVNVVLHSFWHLEKFVHKGSLKVNRTS